MKIFSKWRQRKPNNIRKAGISDDESPQLDMSDNELLGVTLPKSSFPSDSFSASHNVKHSEEAMVVPKNFSKFLSYTRKPPSGEHDCEMTLLMYRYTVQNAFLSIGTLGDELLSKLESDFKADEPNLGDLVEGYNERNLGVECGDNGCHCHSSINGEKGHVVDSQMHSYSCEEEQKTVDEDDGKLNIGISSATSLKEDDRVQVEMLRPANNQALITSYEAPLELMRLNLNQKVVHAATEVPNNPNCGGTHTQEPSILKDKRAVLQGTIHVNAHSSKKMSQTKRFDSSKPEFITESSSPHHIGATQFDYLPTCTAEQYQGNGRVAQAEIEEDSCHSKQRVHIGNELSPLRSDDRDHYNGSYSKHNTNNDISRNIQGSTKFMSSRFCEEKLGLFRSCHEKLGSHGNAQHRWIGSEFEEEMMKSFYTSPRRQDADMMGNSNIVSDQGLVAGSDSKGVQREMDSTQLAIRKKVDCTYMTHRLLSICQDEVNFFDSAQNNMGSANIPIRTAGSSSIDVGMIDLSCEAKMCRMFTQETSSSACCDPQNGILKGSVSNGSTAQELHLMGASDYPTSSMGSLSSSACSTPTSMDSIEQNRANESWSEESIHSKQKISMANAFDDEKKEEVIDYEMATLSCLKVISTNYHLDLKRLIRSVTPTYLAKQLLNRLKHIGRRRQTMYYPDSSYQSKFYKFLRTFRVKHKVYRASGVLKRELDGRELAFNNNYIEGMCNSSCGDSHEELQTIEEEGEEEEEAQEDDQIRAGADDPSTASNFRDAQDIHCENWIKTDDEYVVLELEGNKDTHKERENLSTCTKFGEQDRDRNK